ncbi:hypothetical protein HYR99_40705 [Candidatus Poribacteria bacterium]|nr:hypothetical protein [Candidatus Poribacteria bacterium]
MPYIHEPREKGAAEGKEGKRHVDVIINPLSVISRLNPGQLYETHLGLVSMLKGTRYVLNAFKSKTLGTERRRSIPFSMNNQIDGLIQQCWEQSADFHQTFAANVPEAKSLEAWLQETTLSDKPSAINACFQTISGVQVLRDLLRHLDLESIQKQCEYAETQLATLVAQTGTGANRIARLERQIECYHTLQRNGWTGAG